MVQTTAKRTSRLRLFAQILLPSYNQTKLDMESHRVHRKQTCNNVFVKPNEQRRACSNIVMARKRTFRGTRKERFR